jgi:hypothetical protein
MLRSSPVTTPGHGPEPARPPLPIDPDVLADRVDRSRRLWLQGQDAIRRWRKIEENLQHQGKTLPTDLAEDRDRLEGDLDLLANATRAGDALLAICASQDARAGALADREARRLLIAVGAADQGLADLGRREEVVRRLTDFITTTLASIGEGRAPGEQELAPAVAEVLETWMSLADGIAAQRERYNLPPSTDPPGSRADLPPAVLPQVFDLVVCIREDISRLRLLAASGTGDEAALAAEAADAKERACEKFTAGISRFTASVSSFLGTAYDDYARKALGMPPASETAI